ncbi:hypothetical protein C9374_002521 [Naegleria lovaniensis]|uniref:Guanylate cyclase domain-containing protein n=1 Tax=Naegleria lovaniensis TaxID=51637 RepID=A0AA88GTJ4_NAELO|nr:uncharacterized protein C9374_002521 [Naegleria lovaniensis]KAG2386777.1 hypothetical protein C9374_002521 [Naegleria lovaniensis]
MTNYLGRIGKLFGQNLKNPSTTHMQQHSPSDDHPFHSLVQHNRSQAEASYQLPSSSSLSDTKEKNKPYHQRHKAYPDCNCLMKTVLSPVKNYASRACHPLPRISSLVTIMNVLVVFFLLQFFISVGTVFIVLSSEGTLITINAEESAHGQAYEKVLNALTQFMSPSEAVTTTFHNHFLAFGLDSTCHTTWARLMAVARVLDSQITNMYFADKLNRVSVFEKRKQGNSVVMVPCYGPNATLTLSYAPTCRSSHLMYKVTDEGIIISSESQHKDFYLKNVTNAEWFQLITKSLNFSSSTHEIHLPLGQKYSIWSNIIQSPNNGNLSTFVSLLIREPKNGAFVGVAALEYGLADLNEYLTNLLPKETPHSIIVLDDKNHIWGACLKLSNIMQEEELYIASQGKVTQLHTRKGMIGFYYYSISFVPTNNIVVKLIILTEHVQFLISSVNTRVTTWVMLILILSLSVVLLLIVLKTITHPLQRLGKKMTNILRLDRTRSVGVEATSLFRDVKQMELSVETFRKALLYFSLFIPDHVVKYFLGNNDSESELLTVKRQVMSIVVLDLNDFTELQKIVGNVTFSQILSKILTEVTSSVQYNEGFVFEVSVKNGLKIYGLWNDATAPVENHETKATAAALEIKEIVENKIEMVKKEYHCSNINLFFKVVLASGLIDLGFTGSTISRICFSCFGDTVAVCEVLLEHCGQNEVLLCENVYQKVSNMFLCFYKQTIPYRSTVQGERCELRMYMLRKYLKDSNAYEQHIASKLLQIRKRRSEIDSTALNTDSIFISLCMELQNLGAFRMNN